MDLKKLLKFSGPDVFGLDVGSSSVKLVQLQRTDNGFTAVAASKKDIQAEEGEEEVVHNHRTVRGITDCCRDAQVQSKYAVCGQCGQDVAVRYFKFPTIPSEEIHSAVALEAEQVCPFNVDEGVLDYQLIPDGSDSIKGVLVAATNKSVKAKSKYTKEASLVPVLMDVDGLALLNCLHECVGCQDGEALAVLNVGHEYSTLVITGEHSVPFVRDITHAGAKIIGTLNEQTGLSEKKVSDILFSDECPEEESMLLEASLEEACKVLIDDVNGTLRYYGAQKKMVRIDTLHVCGGFSQAEGFIDIMNNNLQVDVVLWNPFEKISFTEDCPGAKLLKTQGPALAVAAGLAMRSI